MLSPRLRIVRAVARPVFQAISDHVHFNLLKKLFVKNFQSLYGILPFIGLYTSFPPETIIYDISVIHPSITFRESLSAAIAAGRLLYPYRTQKISPPAFYTVLKCASLREL